MSIMPCYDLNDRTIRFPLGPGRWADVARAACGRFRITEYRYQPGAVMGRRYDSPPIEADTPQAALARWFGMLVFRMFEGSRVRRKPPVMPRELRPVEVDLPCIQICAGWHVFSLRAGHLWIEPPSSMTKGIAIRTMPHAKRGYAYVAPSLFAHLSSHEPLTAAREFHYGGGIFPSIYELADVVYDTIGPNTYSQELRR